MILLVIPVTTDSKDEDRSFYLERSTRRHFFQKTANTNTMRNHNTFTNKQLAIFGSNAASRARTRGFRQVRRAGTLAPTPLDRPVQTESPPGILYAWWITGFTDGDGCFSISFAKRLRLNTKIDVRAGFSISQHMRSKSTLEQIQAFFGCGSLRFDKRDHNYKFDTPGGTLICISDKIIPHFTKYPCLTAKQTDFLLLQRAIKLIQERRHLDCTGIVDIFYIAFQMNPSGKRKYSYQDLLDIVGIGPHDPLRLAVPPKSDSPERFSERITQMPPELDPWWVTGFSDAEGSFVISGYALKRTATLARFSAVFVIGQHAGSSYVLKAIQKFFKCGSIYFNTSDNTYHYRVSRLTDIMSCVIPHFEKYPLITSKFKSFVTFRQVCEKLVKGEHKTAKGTSEILKLIETINPKKTHALTWLCERKSSSLCVCGGLFRPRNKLKV
uniref:LAGLIDADG homing endonuclease n=1 Tax=Marophrys sp. SRT127 TaxID=2488311 RepID=A0A455RGP1_9EUKA|nr:LAGLIDADG homing endonuclease [Marophrys sp. SRT127]